MKIDSTRRLMAIERSRAAYETLYGNSAEKQAPRYMSSVELETLAKRMSQSPASETDRVAILGYN